MAPLITVLIFTTRSYVAKVIITATLPNLAKQ